MRTPFDRAPTSIPVTVITSRDASQEIATGASFIRLEPPLHAHGAEPECVACAARSDVRGLLFDLLQRSRQTGENPVLSVVVDATALADPEPVIDRLAGTAPALGLRDHTVARSFHLARVL